MALIIPQIGSHQFLTLKGDVDVPGEQLSEPIERIGIDGSAFQFQGKRAKAFTMQSGVDVANNSAAKSLLDSYKQAIGTVVTLKTEQDNTYNYMLVRDVQPGEVQRMISATGGLTTNPQYFVSATWTLHSLDI